MKHLLLTTIATVLLVGCATTQSPEPSDISIHGAAWDGNIEAVKQHLADGVDVNAKDDEYGATSLHITAEYGYKEIVKLLIDAGADVHEKDKNGSTPLHNAAFGGYKEVVELLIANGADVNAKNDDGETPMDWAETVYNWQSSETKAAKKETAKLLRKHGGKTGEELALMPRLEYGKDRWPFGFSFTAKDEMTYVVEVTQDFKQWGELETIKGTGKQVKFIDPRQPLVQFKRNFYRVKVVD